MVADDSLREPGTTRTGLLLAEVVKRIGGVDVVLAGDSSIDNGAQLVPAVLAGALGWPALAQVTSVSGAPGSLSIERNHLGGSQRLTAMCEDAGRDPSSLLRSASLSIEGTIDEARAQIDAWRAAGFGYLIVGWPSGGREQVEAFASAVL